jgi:hypothetical protein
MSIPILGDPWEEILSVPLGTIIKAVDAGGSVVFGVLVGRDVNRNVATFHSVPEGEPSDHYFNPRSAEPQVVTFGVPGR